MLKTNYHTHLLYCNHAEGHAEDYVKMALQNGYTELGITDHSPIPECSMSLKDYYRQWLQRQMKLDTMYRDYLPEIEACKKKYQGKIKILSGFETEYLESNLYFTRLLRSQVDYLNLGVHYFEYQGHIYNSYGEINTKTIYGYMEACLKGMRSGLFNTLVHPDLFMFHYEDKNGNRTFDENCKRVTEAIIECAIENDVYLEVNVGGVHNSKRFSSDGSWIYPCREFWRIASKYKDLKILIGVDAHTPDSLIHPFVLEVINFTKELGLQICETMEVKH